MTRLLRSKARLGRANSPRRPTSLGLVLIAILLGCAPASGHSNEPSAGARSSPSPAQPSPSDPTTTPSPISFFPALATGPLGAGPAAALQKALDDLVKNGAPDAIAAVITPGGQWSGAAGVDGPNGRAATPGDEFNIASVSKPILATLILRLAQDGKLDLDTPMSNYLGTLPVNTNGATVRQALAMRSGIGDTERHFVDEAWADCARRWTRADVLQTIPVPFAAPGTTFHYSNPTYKVLSYMAEEVAGTELDAAFKETTFTPAGATRILLQGGSTATPKPWALPIAGHSGSFDLAAFGTGGALPCLSIASASSGAAAIASDASSLARWGWALFSGKLLDRDRLGAMLTVDPDGYGLAIEELHDFGSDRAYGTHGSQTGYAAFLVVVPDRNVVAVLFINDDQADVEGGARKLLLALDQ